MNNIIFKNNKVEVDNRGFEFYQDIVDVDDYIKNHKDPYYCECFILDDGRIVDARPSHQTMLYSLTKHYDPSVKSWEDLDITWFIEEMFAATAAVEVRYESQTGLYNEMTKLQKESYDKMVLAGVIQDGFHPISQSGYLHMISLGILKDKRRYK